MGIMKSPSVCLIAVVCLLVSLSTSVVAGQDWRIELVPSRHSEGKGAVLYATKSLDKFYIVLHNTSGKDQRLWRAWCPWGYENFSLVAELESGEKINLTRPPKKWGKSYPDAALVGAGKSYVFEIHLGGSTWMGTKKLPQSPFKLTVSYQIPPTPEAEQKHVWTGKVSSHPLTVTLRQ